MDTTTTLTEQQALTLANIQQDMPPQQPPAGHRPNWGNNAARGRAYYLAAQLGHHADPKCNSCDADVWDFLRQFIPKP